MEEQTREVARHESKTPINIDITGGIVPHNYDELLQFAALYKQSGLAPKSFQTHQQLAIAIGMCLELDRPILTGIQDMAVINGKVSIYGDAALAIVRRSGLLDEIREWSEGERRKDDWSFYCMIRRAGDHDCRNSELWPNCPECNNKDNCEFVGTWTWEDSKAAGFDDPQTREGKPDKYTPWRRFTKRMMQFKARNFILRDKFGDVIKGMTLAEDAQDYIDVTPQPSLKLQADAPETIPDGQAAYVVRDMPKDKEKVETAPDPSTKAQEKENAPIEESPETQETDEALAAAQDTIAQFKNLKKEENLVDWAKKHYHMIHLMHKSVKVEFDAKWLRMFGVEYPNMPEPKGNGGQNFDFLKQMADMKKKMGEEAYYNCLGVHGFEKSNQVTDRTTQIEIYRDMKSYMDRQNEPIDLDKKPEYSEDDPER